MNSRIEELGDYTYALLRNLSLEADAKKITDANQDLKDAIRSVKGLNWDSLFALGEAERHELTASQQKVHECYAKLKRILLETYKELFTAVKGM